MEFLLAQFAEFYIKVYTSSPTLANDYAVMITGLKNTGTIKANVNQNYIQPNWKLKAVKLKVGGRATIYEDTKIKIRCPVKKFKR